jgi:hypothetical protein
MRSLAIGALALAAACAQPAPEGGEQQRVLKSVAEFAHDYIARLPNFACRRTTNHYRTKPGSPDYQLQAKVTQELSYYGHEEHYQTVEINDQPKTKIPAALAAEGFISTNGNFGWILSELFEPATQAAFQWKGWETLRDKPAYVFSYHVNLANSRAQSSRCVSWVLFQNCKAITYAYHGLLYIAKDPLRIMRITMESEDVPASHSPGSESVDYEMVSVAGSEYLLPVADVYETYTGKTLFKNESVYRDYQKFTAESSMSTSMEGVTTAPGTPPPRAAPKPLRAARPAESGKPTEAAHYFALRDAVVKGKVPLIARGAVAAAFNDAEQAQRDLGAVIKSAPDSEGAAMAAGLLAAVYARNGRMKDALAYVDRAGAGISNPEWKDSRERLEVLARHPEQNVAARSYSKLRYTNKHNSIEIPLKVNGKSADFILDTGASLSVISESGARTLGVTIHDDTFSMSDITGKRLACHAGTAAELAAGGFRLRNVPFCVLPDSQPGFTADPGSAPAILGLPVLMAFGTLRWDAAGNFEVGFASRRARLQDANLCFDGSSLLLEATVARRKLSFALDTGNPTTMLFSSWGEAGGATGARAPHHFQGLGEAVQIEAVDLGQMRFLVGGKELVLKSVPMLAEPIEAECTNCSGNAGMDLLGQARRVTVDFGAMRLFVER